MRKEKTLFVIGIWVAILPFLGFPNSFRRVLFLITGLALMYLAYLYYIEVRVRLLKNTNHSRTFVDNMGSVENKGE